jgi:excisionase family DNA binding protein
MVVMIEGEEYLTTDEACELLGVKAATLYAYVSRGLLRSYRQGIKRQRLYKKGEIARLREFGPSESRRQEGETWLPPADSWIQLH